MGCDNMTNYEWLVKNDKLAKFICDIKYSDGHALMNECKMEFPYVDLTFNRIAKWLQEEHKEPLKPCPFCGGDGEMIQIHQFIYYVRCKNCEAQTKNYGRIDDAEEKWNRRTEK